MYLFSDGFLASNAMSHLVSAECVQPNSKTMAASTEEHCLLRDLIRGMLMFNKSYQKALS